MVPRFVAVTANAKNSSVGGRSTVTPYPYGCKLVRVQMPLVSVRARIRSPSTIDGDAVSGSPLGWIVKFRLAKSATESLASLRFITTSVLVAAGAVSPIRRIRNAGRCFILMSGQVGYGDELAWVESHQLG